MDNKEILTKAIDKALHNGWKKPSDPWRLFDTAEYIGEGLWKFWCGGTWYQTTIEPIIFNHEFCKALWGEEYIMSRKEIKEAGFSGAASGGYMVYMVDMIKGAGWKHHLKKMVISEDPIKYLGDNLDAN